MSEIDKLKRLKHLSDTIHAETDNYLSQEDVDDINWAIQQAEKLGFVIGCLQMSIDANIQEERWKGQKQQAFIILDALKHWDDENGDEQHG